MLELYQQLIGTLLLGCVVEGHCVSLGNWEIKAISFRGFF